MFYVCRWLTHLHIIISDLHQVCYLRYWQREMYAVTWRAVWYESVNLLILHVTNRFSACGWYSLVLASPGDRLRHQLHVTNDCLLLLSLRSLLGGRELWTQKLRPPSAKIPELSTILSSCQLVKLVLWWAQSTTREYIGAEEDFHREIYLVERTSKTEIKPEEQGEKTESGRENFRNET